MMSSAGRVSTHERPYSRLWHPYVDTDPWITSCLVKSNVEPLRSGHTLKTTPFFRRRIVRTRSIARPPTARESGATAATIAFV